MAKNPKSSVYLPSDILYEILARLRVKTLTRFRCVSKSWSSLISSSSFQQEHHRRSQENPLLLVTRNQLAKPPMGRQDLPIHLILSTYSSEGTLLNEFDKKLLWISSNLIQSCLGWVCIDARIDHLLVINPSTNNVITLPPHRKYTSSFTIGFGYLASTMELKVVRFFGYTFNQKQNLCEVFTLGTTKWRQAKASPYRVRRNAPFLNGALHLQPASRFPSKKQVDYIAAFDIETEEYTRRIRLPECYYNKTEPLNWCNMELKEAGGSLCLQFDRLIVLPQLKFWLLKDYDNGVWVKYTIDLSSIRCDAYEVVPLAFMGDGNFLVNVRGKGGQELVHYYNSQTKRVPLRIDNGYCHVLLYVESLLGLEAGIRGA